MHEILNPESVPTPVATTTTTTTTRPPVLESSPTEPHSDSDESSESISIKKVRESINNFTDSLNVYKDKVPSNEEIEAVDNARGEIEKDIREAFANYPTDDRKKEWTDEVENTAKALWEKHLGPKVGQLTNENPRLTDLTYWDAYNNQATELKEQIKRNVGEDSVLITGVDNWLETIAADKTDLEERQEALADAVVFFKKASSAKSQKERKELIDQASESMKTEKNNKWSDVQKQYADAKNLLQKAISAYERVENKENEFVDRATKVSNADHIAAYSSLQTILGELETARKSDEGKVPEDAMDLYGAASNKVGKLLEASITNLSSDVAALKARCEKEQSQDEHQRNEEEVKNRKDDTRLPPSIQKRYADLLDELQRPVKLTIKNKAKTPIHVSIDGNHPSILIDAGKDHSFNIDKWSKKELRAKAAGKWPEDYASFKPRTVSIEREDHTEEIELSLNDPPSVTILPPSDGTSTRVSRDGKNWEALNARKTYPAEAHKPFSVRWQVSGVVADYNNPSGEITVNVGNRGKTFERQIPDPVIKNLPVVRFTSQNKGPALNWTVVRDSGVGKPIEVPAGKSEAVLPEPRTNWIAKAEFKDSEDAREWFPVEEQHFRTGNRGTTNDIVITQRRRPEIRVTNASLAAFEIDGKPVDPGEEVSLFGEGENTNRFYNISLLNVANSFYKNEGKTLLAFGAANSTTNFEIYLEIDGKKMKVEEGDPRFDDHSCFVNWTNQLERLKDNLRKDYREELRAFLGFCEKWMETQREVYDPVKDEKTAKALHLSLFVAQCRCLVLEWKIAEVLDDTDKRTEIEGEIRKLANLNNSKKLTRGFDEDTKTDSEKLERGSNKDTETVWDEMVKRWPALQD